MHKSKEKKSQLTATNYKKAILSADSPFAVKEAYNATRTKLLFMGKGEKCPVFAVTSSLPGDGKTTNAVNLAVSIALADQRVLLIDADMRKPTLHRYFGMECKNGLSQILAGLTSEINLVNTEYPGLFVLTAGIIPPNPAELLSSPQFEKLMKYVREYFDVIIIDTPPINIVTDAAVIAENVTGYIMVVQSGKSHIDEVTEALRHINETEGTVVGFMLNDPNDKSDTQYHNGYYKKYGQGYYGYSDKPTEKDEVPRK